jgi:hypothetical protein
MPERTNPVAIPALEAPIRIKPSNYPQPFAARILGREKRPLGDLFDLTNFGVNLTQPWRPVRFRLCVTLIPGRTSSSTF